MLSIPAAAPAARGSMRQHSHAPAQPQPRARLQAEPARQSAPHAEPLARERQRLAARGPGLLAPAPSRAFEEPLPPDIAATMRSRFGHDFSRVRVTRNDTAVAAAGASALTAGERIRFAPRQFRPDHPRGIALIGHELAHVVQQRRGRSRTGLSPHTPTADAELEAERAGQRARRGLPTAIQLAAAGPQARMGMEFQGSNTIEYGYDLASASPRWEPAPRKSAEFHGRTGPPHVKLESDSRGDFEFVTNPYASRSGLLGEVAEAVRLTRHILSWTRLPGEPEHVRLAQRQHGTASDANARIHRGSHWSTMEQVNADKGAPAADAVRMHIEDASFWANPQVTEGVRLEEVEGFLAQNLDAIEPAAGRADAISARVDRAVGDAAVARDFAALPELDRAQVRGFLAIVTALFLFARRYQPGNPVIKESFSILHRTRVSAMYRALGTAARGFVQRRAFAGGSPFLAALGATRGERLFERGYDTQATVDRRARRGEPVDGDAARGGIRGPTVGGWFDSIANAREGVGDAMSPLQFGTRSMGRFGMDAAPDGTDSLVVIEVRNWGRRLSRMYEDALRHNLRAQLSGQWHPGDPVPNSIPATQWQAWAIGRLRAADAAGRGSNFTP
ncbi:MAG: DUF4157 domain-containing protein [Planctomycetes bacterium]|nr:DUF4157 domain-containing protein [Planctomycetota bacterium]